MRDPARTRGESALGEEVRTRLDENAWGRPLRTFRSTDSTNSRARTWALEGAPEGAAVLAEYQTAGRGRQGRTWTSEPGRNLLFSLVLRPGLPEERRGLVTIGAAVAVAETCAEAVGARPVGVEWPNDVLIGTRKCCGMLLESTEEALILGVGCNVNQIDFPPELADRATSLRLESARPQDRAALFVQLVDRIRDRYRTLTAEDELEDLRTSYEDRLVHLGESIRLRLSDREKWIEGTVRGLAPDGGLRLKTGDGLHVLRAGEVTTAH